MHDLVIRNGKIIDGSGNKAFYGDVAIDGEKISIIGKVEQPGKEEIDAKGNLVTPGWVDIHTHYDGQVCWDPYITPSSWHGVTSVVMGNCGVGFAPVKPGDENFLVQLMEGVEDIPGSALHEGADWNWETFPEFLDAIEKCYVVIQNLKKILKSKKMLTNVGDEGGFAPSINTNEQALELIVDAIEKSNLKPGKDLVICLDVAAN